MADNTPPGDETPPDPSSASGSQGAPSGPAAGGTGGFPNMPGAGGRPPMGPPAGAGGKPGSPGGSKGGKPEGNASTGRPDRPDTGAAPGGKGAAPGEGGAEGPGKGMPDAAGGLAADPTSAAAGAGGGGNDAMAKAAQNMAQAAREGDGMGAVDEGVKAGAVAAGNALAGPVGGEIAGRVLETETGRTVTRAVSYGVVAVLFSIATVILLILSIIAGVVGVLSSNPKPEPIICLSANGDQQAIDDALRVATSIAKAGAEKGMSADAVVIAITAGLTESGLDRYYDFSINKTTVETSINGDATGWTQLMGIYQQQPKEWTPYMYEHNDITAATAIMRDPYQVSLLFFERLHALTDPVWSDMEAIDAADRMMNDGYQPADFQEFLGVAQATMASILLTNGDLAEVLGDQSALTSCDGAPLLGGGTGSSITAPLLVMTANIESHDTTTTQYKSALAKDLIYKPDLLAIQEANHVSDKTLLEGTNNEYWMWRYKPDRWFTEVPVLFRKDRWTLLAQGKIETSQPVPGSAHPEWDHRAVNWVTVQSTEGHVVSLVSVHMMLGGTPDRPLRYAEYGRAMDILKTLADKLNKKGAVLLPGDYNIQYSRDKQPDSPENWPRKKYAEVGVISTYEALGKDAGPTGRNPATGTDTGIPDMIFFGAGDGVDPNDQGRIFQADWAHHYALWARFTMGGSYYSGTDITNAWKNVDQAMNRAKYALNIAHSYEVCRSAGSISFVATTWSYCDLQCNHITGWIWGYAATGEESARTAWITAQAGGYAHPGDRNPPVGALMYFDTNPTWQHAAVYVGNNEEQSNWPTAKIERRKWGDIGGYLGWADPKFPNAGTRLSNWLTHP